MWGTVRVTMGQIRTYEQQNTQEGDPPRFWAQNPRNENTKKKRKKTQLWPLGLIPPCIAPSPSPK